MSKRGHVPIRMCIGCRRRRKKEEMLRFIQRRDGAVFTIEKKGVHGRSFYLCPDLICLKMAKKKKKTGGIFGIDGSFVSIGERFGIREEGG